MITPDELKADAVAIKKKSKVTMKQLMSMGEEMQKLQAQIENKVEEAKGIKAQYDNIAEKLLPEAMQDCGCKDFTLNDGSGIAIQRVVSCGIDDGNREAALKWLRDNGHGDIIKNEVRVTFGKEEEKYAEDLLSNIAEMTQHDWKCGGIERQEAVHPQTLKAFVTQQIEAGVKFPTETFKLYVGKVAKLNKPKKSKK